MQTVIYNKEIYNKINGKFTPNFFEKIIDSVSENPKIGKKLMSVNNLYLLELGNTIDKKSEYNLAYYFENKNFPIYLINIFKRKEKDILTKIISNLANEKIGNLSFVK
ncbi:MAG: hypothetical protein IPO64_15990 [Bacteroidetes bacterium]|jgi:hypothetical protein|nr:hypothetical protein [Bacteroidota bacterium]MBL0079497.1 hypothetical protein [Bacteroidota bacterium]MBP7256870.1 hypothetical protein [Chitinophagales bacterium]